MYAQGYFAYDSKKSGGVTISHLRFGPDPIRKPYQIRQADYIACHRQAYVYKYDLLRGFKPGGTFLLNCVWTPEELEEKLPAMMKRKLAALHAKFYIINAVKIAEGLGLGGRINMIMQAAFFKLTQIISEEDAVKYLKEAVEHSYGRKGQDVVNQNNAAIDEGMHAFVEIPVPEAWSRAVDQTPKNVLPRPEFISSVCDVMNRQEGMTCLFLLLSAWKTAHSQLVLPSMNVLPPLLKYRNGSLKIVFSATAVLSPCPHATIRPVIATEEEAAAAPDGFIVRDLAGAKAEIPYCH